jgi:cyclopentanol dehydrogenase
MGFGGAAARMFAREGAKVVLTDIKVEMGEATAAQIRENGGDVAFMEHDVTDEQRWQEVVAETVARYGKLDVLVNNAGIFPMARVEDTSGESWDQVMGINAKGVFLGTKHAIPEMRKAGGGSIVNISSVAGLIGSSHSASYNASKGAVRLLTKSTAIQYGSEGIRANSVHPGLIETEMSAAMRADEPLLRRRLASTPMRRAGQPEEVAYGVLYLASDESSFVTGSELVIDGGTTAQ